MISSKSTATRAGSRNDRRHGTSSRATVPVQMRAVTPAGLKRLEKNAHRACDLLGAMANTSRLMILCQLANGEKSVSDLQPAIGLSQSALSQHLAVLRRRQLVRTRRAGQSIYYSLASGEAAAVMETLHEQFCRR
jgi:DNA-binding transcriptional ArsR family regulator